MMGATVSRNSSELSKRVMTGVAGVAVLLALVIWGGWFGIFALTTALSLAMIFEFAKITFSLPDQVEKRYALLLAAWLIDMGDFLLPRAELELYILSFLALFSYFLFSANRQKESDFSTHFKECMYSLFGISYLVFLPLYLPKIHEASNGVAWTILFLLIVWSVDTGAYFTGLKFGRRKLYPRISPKKTVEGSWGGLATAFVMTLIYKVAFFHDLPWLGVLVVPFVVGTVAQVGDLCESFLKRAFDKKDSGSFLPGHGGFLDRFDSVVFSLPVMYACVRLFG